ncbi:hypothetical protein SAMN05444161_4716 [Rhizobiales bacterium GAS191]|nr:hypothetical protein SAMN05444161_4716 [Rhizobiales bacterium GAS191]
MNWPVFYLFAGPILAGLAGLSFFGMDVLLERYWGRRAVRSKTKSEGTTEHLRRISGQDVPERGKLEEKLLSEFFQTNPSGRIWMADLERAVHEVVTSRMRQLPLLELVQWISRSQKSDPSS